MDIPIQDIMQINYTELLQQLRNSGIFDTSVRQKISAGEPQSTDSNCRNVSLHAEKLICRNIEEIVHKRVYDMSEGKAISVDLVYFDRAVEQRYHDVRKQWPDMFRNSDFLEIGIFFNFDQINGNPDVGTLYDRLYSCFNRELDRSGFYALAKGEALHLEIQVDLGDSSTDSVSEIIVFVSLFL